MLKSPYPSLSPYAADADIPIPNSPYTVHDADTLRAVNDPRAKRVMGVNAYEMFNPVSGTPRKLLAREGTEFTANELASGGVQTKNYGPDKSGRRDVVDVNTNNGNLAENLLKNHLAVPAIFGNVPEDQKRKLNAAYTGADIAFDNGVPNPYADKIRAVPALEHPASTYADYVLPKPKPQGALARGVDILQQSGYAALGLAGRAVGSKDLQNWGEKNANAQDKEIAANPAKFPSYKDVHGVGDAVGFIGERIGESIPSILPMLAGGALGVAGRTVLGGLSKSVAGSLGAFAGGVPMHAGEIEHDQQSRPNPVSPGKVLAGAALNSALDTVGAGVAVERLLSATAAKSVKDAAKQILTSAAVSIPTEGATEAAQEATKVALHAVQDPNYQPLGKDKADAIEQVTEAGVGGAAAGLGMGVLSRSVGVASKTLRAQDEIKTKAAIDEDNKSIEAAANKPFKPKEGMKMEGGKEQVEVTKAIQDKLESVKQAYAKQAGFNELATAAPALSPKLKNQFQENLGDFVHQPHHVIAIQSNAHLRDFADKLNDLKADMKPKDFQALLKQEGINLDTFKDTGYDPVVTPNIAANRFASPEQQARAQARVDRQRIIKEIFNDPSDPITTDSGSARPQPKTQDQAIPSWVTEDIPGEALSNNPNLTSVDEQPTSVTAEPTTPSTNDGLGVSPSTSETPAADGVNTGGDPRLHEQGDNTAGGGDTQATERPTDSAEIAPPDLETERSSPTVSDAANSLQETPGDGVSRLDALHQSLVPLFRGAPLSFKVLSDDEYSDHPHSVKQIEEHGKMPTSFYHQKTQSITLPQSVADAVNAGNPHALSVLAHEIGHHIDRSVLGRSRSLDNASLEELRAMAEGGGMPPHPNIRPVELQRLVKEYVDWRDSIKDLSPKDIIATRQPALLAEATRARPNKASPNPEAAHKYATSFGEWMADSIAKDILHQTGFHERQGYTDLPYTPGETRFHMDRFGLNTVEKPSIIHASNTTGQTDEQIRDTHRSEWEGTLKQLHHRGLSRRLSLSDSSLSSSGQPGSNGESEALSPGDLERTPDPQPPRSDIEQDASTLPSHLGSESEGGIGGLKPAQRTSGEFGINPLEFELNEQVRARNDIKEGLNQTADKLLSEPAEVRNARVDAAERESITNERNRASIPKEVPAFHKHMDRESSDFHSDYNERYSHELDPEAVSYHGKDSTRSNTSGWEDRVRPYASANDAAFKKLISIAKLGFPGEYEVVPVLDADGNPTKYVAKHTGSDPEARNKHTVELVPHKGGWIVSDTLSSFDQPNGEVSEEYINNKIAEARTSATQKSNPAKEIKAIAREDKLPIISPEGVKTDIDASKLLWLGHTLNNGDKNSLTKGEMNIAFRHALTALLDRGYKLGHDEKVSLDDVLENVTIARTRGQRITFKDIRNSYPDTLAKEAPEEWMTDVSYGNEQEQLAGEGNTYGEKQEDNEFQIEKGWRETGSSKSNPVAEDSILGNDDRAYHSDSKLIALSRSVAKLVGLKVAFKVADEEGIASILADLKPKGRAIAARIKSLHIQIENLEGDGLAVKGMSPEEKEAEISKLQGQITSAETRIQALRDTYQRLSELTHTPSVIYNDASPKLEDREAVIFIPKHTNQPVIKLAHEMGHLIKREYVDQLIASTDPDAKQVVDELFGTVDWNSDAEALAADEMFARNTERWLSSNEKPKTVLDKFYKGLANRLKKLYNYMRHRMEFSKAAAFDKFMDTLIHERGDLPASFKPKAHNTMDPYSRAVASLVAHERLPFRPKGPHHHNYDGILDFDRARDAGKWISGHLEPVGNMMAKANPVWMSADSELRSYGEVGTWLANHFHIRPGQEGVKHGHQTIPAEIQAVGAPWYIKAAKLIDKLPNPGPKILALSSKSKAEYEANAARMREIAKELVLGSTGKQDHEYVHPESKAIAGFFAEIREHFNDEYSLNIKNRMNYFPLVFDKLKMQGEAAQKLWIKTLVDTGKFTPKQAAKIYEGIRNSDGALVDEPEDIENGTVLGSALSAKYARVFEDDVAEALANAGFYSEDVGSVVTQYTHALIKRAVEQKHFGGFKTDELGLAMRDADGNMIYSPTGSLDARLKLATSLNHITLDQRKRIAKVILPGLMGRLGANISPETRAVMSWTQTGLNVALLPFAWFSSIADVAGVAQKAGVHKAPIKAMNNVMGAFIQSLGAKDQDAFRKMMTNDLGAIKDAMVEHVLADSSSMEYMTPGTQKINDHFFRFIQMKRWTDYVRVASARLAVNDIQDMYEAGNDKGLGHLSLSREDVKAWMDAGKPLEGIMQDHANIGYAINRWVDEASIRPNASMRPTWGSDHRMALLWYLKGFMWGYYETIGRQVFSQMRDAEGIAKVIPLITLGAMALPLAAAGYELRKMLGEDVVSAVTGLPNMRNDPDNYWLEMLYRSGLLGPSDLIRQMMDAGDHGQLAFTAAGGPVVAKFVEAFDHGLFDTIATTLPGVAQSSTLRTAIKNGIGYD